MSHIMPYSHDERRKSPRFQIPITLTLSVSGIPEEQAIDAAVVNVSMNGVYCKVNHYLPLFDKVLITFVLPESNDPPCHLVSQCEGVVVRIEPEEEEPGRPEYYAALYFNNLSDSSRELLQAMLFTYTK